MISLQKSAFNNAMTSVTRFQNQVERMTKPVVGRIPEPGAQIFNAWKSVFQKGFDNFRRSGREGFDSLERLFSDEEPGDEGS
jgi:hypothetical protein